MPGTAQISIASDVLDFRGEPTTDALLNRHISYVRSKYLALYSQVNVVPTSHQRNFLCNNGDH